MKITDIGPLMAPVNRLDGVGPGRAERLSVLLARPSAAETRVFDLLAHRPVSTIDRRFITTVAEAPDKAPATLAVKIIRHEGKRSPRAPSVVVAADDTGEMTILYFRGSPQWIAASYPIGAWVRVSGLTERRGERLQMPHPDVSAVIEDPSDAPEDPRFGLAPVYPMTQGITPGVLSGLMAAALEKVPDDLDDWHDPAYAARAGFPSFPEALAALHVPQEPDDLAPHAIHRRRLAADELLASQLALAIVRDRERTGRGIARKWQSTAIDHLETTLPFALTPAQRMAISEISADLAAPHRMTRLVQGDVGSGKTMVAVFAAAMVAGAGGQTAMMAPTDLVARQHFATLSAILEPVGIPVRLLTGKVSEADRATALTDIASGLAKVAVGTHALFQSSVAFADLGLVVVDEQHRFGVHQRMALSEKGAGSDLLVMTATPIPRTLVLAQYGDMDVSRMTDKPAGRQEVDTRALPLTQIKKVVERLAAALDAGEKAYWVCPLVEESETLDVEAATSRHAALTARLGPSVGLITGRTPSSERERIMGAFRDGTLKVLVATTVIEVGVDVPDATIMVIEHAERFGLAQLHQLRGRVGRGARASRCLLLYKSPLRPIAKKRLDTMRATNDGFRIAEDDLALRGEGELLGTRQSGLPTFRFADPLTHADLMQAMSDDARLIVTRDRDLTSPRGKALRALLTLFERRKAIERLRSG